MVISFLWVYHIVPTIDTHCRSEAKQRFSQFDQCIKIGFFYFNLKLTGQFAKLIIM